MTPPWFQRVVDWAYSGAVINGKWRYRYPGVTRTFARQVQRFGVWWTFR